MTQNVSTTPLPQCIGKSFECKVYKTTCTYYNLDGSVHKVGSQRFISVPWCRTPRFIHCGDEAVALKEGKLTASIEITETDECACDLSHCIYRKDE